MAEPPPPSDPADQQAVLDVLVIPRARALLDAQVQDVDELATKALGVLGFAGLVLALLIGARDDLSSYWWIPAIVLAAASVFLLATVWPQQELDSGPDPGPFYERFGAEPRLAATEQMLAHLDAAFDENAPKVAQRTRFFNLGFMFLVFGLLGSLVIVLAS